MSLQYRLLSRVCSLHYCSRLPTVSTLHLQVWINWQLPFLNGSSIGKGTKRLRSSEEKDDESWLPPLKEAKSPDPSQTVQGNKTSGAERQRRYRVKANPGNYEEYLYWDHERWRARQENIKESEQATKNQCRRWRQAAKCSWEKKCAERCIVHENTQAPATPGNVNANANHIKRNRAWRKLGNAGPKITGRWNSLNRSSRKPGNDSKGTEKIMLVWNEESSQPQQSQLNTYWERTKSPPTKTVKRMLEFSTAVVQGLRRKYRLTRSHKEKQAIARPVHNCIKKYRMCARQLQKHVA